LISLLIAAVCCAGAFSGAAPELVKQTRKVMGTFCEIQIYDADKVKAEKAAKEALDEMTRVDGLLSNYVEASELSVMNREAAQGPFRASRELYDFVRECRKFNLATLGAFDPTVGQLARAWGFFSTKPAKPSEEAIALAKSKSGFDKVRLNDSRRTISYTVSGLEIDPGGIGKGYAVDRAVEVLKRRKIKSALVSAGGSTLYGLGHPPGRNFWRVGIKDPSRGTQLLAYALLYNNSVSTSGVLEQSVREADRRYSHIFDPRTGEPIEGICQVSVIAPKAMDSDALTKAAYILSHESIQQLFKKRTGVHAFRIEGLCTTDASPWVTPWSTSGQFEAVQPAP
jgi:thiamine biosynthesis lipoprotein